MTLGRDSALLHKDGLEKAFILTDALLFYGHLNKTLELRLIFYQLKTAILSVYSLKAMVLLF